MLYNSLSYLAFFAVVVALYWAAPQHRMRLGILLVASWVFYAAWYPIYLLLFLAVTAFNYGAAWAVHATREQRPIWSKRFLVGAIVVNLTNLGFFKYANFFLDTGAQLAHALGSEWRASAISVVLPLGISFYTFQKIAYVIDVYRRDAPIIRNPLKMAVFAGFFPQLIAGPIVRSNEFIPQLAGKRRFDAAQFLHGLDLIAIGMFKKVLIADQISPFVDQVFAAPEGLGAGTLLLAIYAYSIQIYCDFSGYTDIGRGCAFCLGYELPRNFQAPYLAGNLTEFWRRWHMTLSNWLRDYLYIPLGGNRRGRARTYVNLILTMGLGGLWHGASWNFVIWGLLHGGGLAVTRWVHERLGVAPTAPLRAGTAWRVFSTVATFHFVALAWVFFRAPTFDSAVTIVGGLIGPRLFGPADLGAIGRLPLLLVATGVVAAASLHVVATWAVRTERQRGRAWALSRPFVYAATLIGALLLAERGTQQFIYFQF